MNKRPLIISTDPGIDDIAAMTLSLFAQELDVRMIVPTWGNVDLKYTLQNTFDLEQFLHTNVPIVKGANQPLVAPKINAASIHGKTGIAGYKFETASAETRQALIKPGLAATLMRDEIMHNKIKTTLLGIGPLTDFALLFKQYPEVLQRIDQIVIMGGNIGRGNHSPLAEYNIAGDPEAASVVFNSGVSIKVAPLEIGNKAHVTGLQMAEIKKCGNVGAMFYAMFSNIHEPDGVQQIKIYDPTAVGILLEPKLFAFKKARVQVELAGRYTYGATSIKFMDNAQANAQIAVDVDTEKFADWFIALTQIADQGR